MLNKPDIEILHDLVCEPKRVEFIETWSRMVVARGPRVTEMGRCWSKYTKFQL